MALFKINKGQKVNLPSTYTEGYCYFTTDDGKFYIDTTNTAAGRVLLNAGKADQLATARTIALTGDVTGSASFNGSTNISITTTVADDSHNHVISNIDNLQTTLNQKIGNGYVCSNLSAFAGNGLKVYLPEIHDGFYAANQRWTVTGSYSGTSNGTYDDSTLARLFNHDYENYVTIPAGCTATFKIDFNGHFPGFPYGKLLINYYSTANPTTASIITIYCDYEPQTIGEKVFTCNTLHNEGYTGNYTFIEAIDNIYYNIKYVIYKIVAPSNAQVQVTGLEFIPNRGSNVSMPFVSKYKAERLYYPLTAPSFIGSLQGNAATATSATIANSIKDSGDGRTLYINYSAAGMTSTSWLGSWNDNTLQAIAPSVLNVGSATKLQTARSIFGKSFNGTADVAGKPLVYGTYTATESTRYANSGIEIRENGLVGNAQSDIGYAPSIGFHWSGRIAATFLFHSDGIFYLRKQDGTSRATLDANLNGNCYGTANYATNAYFLYPQSDIVYGRNNLQYFNASLSTTASATANYGPTADWYHIIRMNHGNSNGYYVDLAACFHNDNFYIKRVANGSNSGYKHIWVEGNSVTSAVWNDYAEYRESNCQEFGRVLVENGDDTLSVSTERLQPFAGVSSDTWGFCQGETEKAKTPIAVAGRVLVYPYRDRNEYKPGDVVCAAPNGTVDIMTPQEEMMYPSRIVGTVSCVPDYEEWGSGDREPAKVNGRIWIKVK